MTIFISSQESFILFNVVGLFKEREERNTPIRYFARTFVIVPLNGGFVIVNEMLFITTATTEQIKGAFKPAPAPLVSTATVPSTSATANATSPPPPVLRTEEEKRMLLASFAQESGMNQDWSKRHTYITFTFL